MTLVRTLERRRDDPHHSTEPDLVLVCELDVKHGSELDLGGQGQRRVSSSVLLPIAIVQCALRGDDHAPTPAGPASQRVGLVACTS